MARQIKTHNHTANTVLLDKDQLQVIFVPTASLKPNPRNARTHAKKQVKQLASSILASGYFSPIVVDEDNVKLYGYDASLSWVTGD